MVFASAKLKRFDPEEWHFYGLWKQDLFSSCFWVGCYDAGIVKKLGLQSAELGALVLNGGNFFVKKSERINIQSQVKEHILKENPTFFAKARKVADMTYESAVSNVEKLRDVKVTHGAFEAFLREAKKLNFIWFLAAAHFVVAAEEMLQDGVMRESYPAEDVPALIPELITPLYYQRRDLFKLKKQVVGRSFTELEKDKERYQALEAHAKKYPWIEVANFIGQPLTVGRLYQQLIHAEDNGAAHPQSQKKRSRAVSKSLRFRAQCMSDAGYIKQAGAEHFAMLTEKAFPFLFRAADTLGISYREFIALTHKEIADGLGGVISSKELKKLARNRDQMNWVVFSDDQNNLVFCEDARDIKNLKKLMIPRVNKDIKEIRGEAANPGKAKGMVRIIMNIDDFHKMNAGDVLVTTMTTPDYVILMQKSSAIITDIGGLLCHAAIVSREMQKPCIIGAKIATKILQDGDWVEVDAGKGIVKILKQAR